MNKRLWFLGIFYFSFFIFYTFTTNFDSGISFINDPSDRMLYFERGSWLPLNQMPYKDVFCEYPHMATYLFAVPFVFIPKNIELYRHEYLVIFSLLMLFFSFFSTVILFRMMGRYRNYFWLILLPASLYFSLNRFDIVPSFFTLLAIYLLSKEYFNLSSIVLAIGFMTKWYPCLLLPVFMVYYFYRFRKVKWSMFGFFIGTVFFISLPTLLNGINCFLVPYMFHMQRPPNTESLFYLVNVFFKYLFDINCDTKFTQSVFFLLQFSMVPLCLTSKIDNIDKVIKWSTLLVLNFILFSKIYSPQWILWFIPLLMLTIKNKNDIIMIIIFDLITYIYFPVAYYVSGPGSFFFSLIIFLKTFILIVIMYFLFKDLILGNKIFIYIQSKIKPHSIL